MMPGSCKYILTLIFLSFCAGSKAQYFKNEAAVDSIKTTGFYSISITPELSRYLKTDFSDLRIADEKGNAIPYIIKSTLPLVKPAGYKPFPIISNETADSGRSIVIIENSNHEKISDFYLKIKNASVSRTIDLSGSDDKQHWYSVIENVMLEKKFVTDDDHYVEQISFPLSSYHYFRLTIYNGKNDPLNIISAGEYSSGEIKAVSPFAENPLRGFLQKDSNNHISYITVFNPELYHVSYISMHVKGPKFFKRNIDITASGQALGNFVISSDSVFQFYLPAFKDSVFEIKISNGDNPPLVIRSLSTGQEEKKVIAYLESGMRYSLQMNNDSMTPPHYDLQNFKDSISYDVPEIKISGIEPIIRKPIVPGKNFFSKAWVWPVIFFVLLLLSFFTLRLLKDVSKKAD